MRRYLDPRLYAKSLIIEERSSGNIVFPDIEADTGKATQPCLCNGPQDQSPANPLPAMIRTHRDAVDQETFPILGLVYGIEHLHAVLRKDVPLLVPQPGVGVGVDHPYDACLVAGY